MKIFGFNTPQNDAADVTNAPIEEMSAPDLDLSATKSETDAPKSNLSVPIFVSDASKPNLSALKSQMDAPNPVLSAPQLDFAVPKPDVDAVISPSGAPKLDLSAPNDVWVVPVADLTGVKAAVAEISPPRALFPGSFLGGQYEIKEVLARGAVNYYLADAGDYGAADLKFVAQRRAAGQTIENGPDAPFFPPATRFFDDENEFAAWEFEPLRALDDWSAHPNDETYLTVMRDLAGAFAALENAGFVPDLTPASLWFDGAGNLKSFGFFDALVGTRLAVSAGDSSPETESKDTASRVPTTEVQGMTAIQQLSAFSSRFAKNSLAAGATLRLDDEFGALPFSEEVKTFARRLGESDFAALSEVLGHLEAFSPVSQTQTALLSDVGMERELNEDCGLIWKSSRAGHARNFSLELLAVADGMGGHEGGEVASDATLGALETAIGNRLSLDFSDNSVVLGAVHEILGEVNDAVVRLTENPPFAALRNKPGSTLVCALRVGSRVFVGNVGDSRAYVWSVRNGLQRLTKDHSYVQDLLDSGALTEEKAWGHPDGSVITSHIGMMRGLKRDVKLHLLGAGDRLILVSDGVVDTLRDAQIEEIVAAHAEVSSLCAALVNAANDAGGFDNITVAALVCCSS